MEQTAKAEQEKVGKLRKNIRLYYFFNILQDPWFFGVILISSLTELAGMSLSDIYFMESVVMLLYTLFEVPSGALADYVGRKYTMVMGVFCLFLGMFGFASMESAVDAWIANILFMLGISLNSGADRALLSDSIHALGRTKELAKIQGRALGLRWFVVAWTSLLGGWLAEYSLRLPLYLCLPSLVAGCIVACLFEEPGRVRTERKQIATFTDLLREMGSMLASVFRLTLKSLVFVANNRRVKWIICFFTLLTVASKVWFFTYNPYFELVGLQFRYFGVIFWALNMIACLSSVYAHKVIERFLQEEVLLLVVGLIGLPILCMGLFVNKGMSSLVVLQNVSRGIMSPLQFAMINEYLSSESKATVLSISTATRGVVEFMVLAMYGTMLSMMGLSTMLIILGLTVLLLAAYGMKKYYQYF